MTKTKKMILTALLLALDIVLSRFLGIRVVNIAFSFGFVPLILSAIWLGPKYSILVGGLTDLIGALLFPVGQYFVGYTISAVIDGAIYGFLLYKKEGAEWSKKEFLIRLVISTFIVSVVCNLFLSSLWSYIAYGKAYLVALVAKLPLEAIRFPIKIITILAVTKILEPITKKYFVKEEQ